MSKNDDKSTYVYEKLPHDYEVDQYGEYKLSVLQKDFQDAGQRHLDSWGYTFSGMQDLGMAFVLSSITIRKFKSFYDMKPFIIKTGTRRPVGIRHFRDLIVIDAKTNEIIAEANSVWAAVDFENHALLGEDDMKMKLKYLEDKLISVEDSKKVRRNKKVLKTDERKVMFTDIDMLGHLTNTRYTDMFYDHLRLDFEKHEVYDYDITYQNETLKDDVIEIFSQSIEKDGYIKAYMHGEVAGELKFAVKAKFKEKNTVK